MRPKFFVSYEKLLPQIRAQAMPIAGLERTHPAGTPLLEAALGTLEIPASRVAWLPVHHRKGFWAALIDK